MTTENTIKELIEQARNTRYLVEAILNAYLLDDTIVEALKKQRN